MRRQTARIRATEESVMEPQPRNVFTVRRLWQRVVPAGMKQDTRLPLNIAESFAEHDKASERAIFSDVRTLSAYLALNRRLYCCLVLIWHCVPLSSFPERGFKYGVLSMGLRRTQ